jgi:hypothetical protein
MMQRFERIPMRTFALMVAGLLVAMPMSAGSAHADGIEPVRPVHHHRPRPHRHVELRGAPTPAPVVIEQGPEVVTLQPAFFSGGGVGVDIGGGAVSSSTVIVRGGSASASAFAFASARASAGVGGGWGGHSGGHGGGHGGGGCGCR